MSTTTIAVPGPKRRQRLTESDAVMQAALTRRLRQQVLVTGVKIAPIVTKIDPADFGLLHIDEGYQRARVGQEVNDLIAVIHQGGQIADAIHVSERPDGTLWIVDGQQRFWAHRDTNTAIKALIHKVDNREAEIRLFIALNSRRKLGARQVVRGWPGPFGDWLRFQNESDKSPLKGMIDFGSHHQRPFDATALLRAVTALLTGITATGDTATAALPRVDTAMKLTHAHAWCDAYVQLLASIFGQNAGKAGRRVRQMPMVALALVAHRKFTAAGRPVFPSSTSRLRNVNWDVQTPSNARQYLPLLEKKIEHLWK